MLPRTLEPEVMDSLEEANSYNEMDHSAVNDLFVADFLNAGGGQGDVLDLGTGTALIPVALCEATTDCRIMAVDAAISMLDLARYNVEAAGFIERITLDKCDAKKLPFEDGMFTSVMSNSIVHHIPEPALVLQEAVRVTAPGGLLFIRDLMRPATEAELEALVLQYAGDEPEHARQMFHDSLHAALTLEEIQGLVADLGFKKETVQATSDRHWTWSASKSR